MVITGVDHFASVCETKLVEWYHKHKPSINIARHNVVIVWSSKVLQNYKVSDEYDYVHDLQGTSN